MLCPAEAGLPIQVDTRGLNQGHVGKRMQVELADGESLEIRLHELTVCDKPEPCCGITYILLSTNRSDGKRDKGAAYWGRFAKLRSFKFWETESHATVFNPHRHGRAAGSRQCRHRPDGA